MRKKNESKFKPLHAHTRAWKEPLSSPNFTIKTPIMQCRSGVASAPHNLSLFQLVTGFKTVPGPRQIQGPNTFLIGGRSPSDAADQIGLHVRGPTNSDLAVYLIWNRNGLPTIRRHLKTHQLKVWSTEITTLLAHQLCPSHLSLHLQSSTTQKTALGSLWGFGGGVGARSEKKEHPVCVVKDNKRK